jgi:hypothetical protein
MKNYTNLLIIPAKFAKNSSDNQRIINCYVGKTTEGKPITQLRKFEKYSTEGIENPTYLLIGIMSGPGFTRVTFTDAKEFEELFIEKWGCLDLTAG